MCVCVYIHIYMYSICTYWVGQNFHLEYLTEKFKLFGQPYICMLYILSNLSFCSSTY